MSEGETTDIETKHKYMMERDLIMEVADLVGIDTYDPNRTKSPPADFLRYECLQIYEAVTGES